MDEFFTTHAVSDLFQVSTQTVLNWSASFANFLSPTATPGTGRRRSFTFDDLKVFALIHDFNKRGYNYEDARLALSAEQRGEIPDTTKAEVTIPSALVVQLRDEITNLRMHLRAAESERDKERGKVELMEKQLTEKEQLIRSLYKQLARHEAQAEDGKSE